MTTTTERPLAGRPSEPSEPGATVPASHLALAGQLQACAAGMRAQLAHPDAPTRDEDDYVRGYARALDDLAAHLRLGDWLPGGLFGEVDLAAIA